MDQNKELKLSNLGKVNKEKNKFKIIKKRKRKIYLKIILVIFITLLIGIAIFSFKIASVGKNIFQSEEDDSILNQIRHLVLADNKKIKYGK